MDFVLMPDHLHIILVEREKNLSNAVKQIKGASAQSINKHLDRRGKVWQEGFFDYRVDTEKKLYSIVMYIDYNPVEAELVERPEDYPYNGLNYPGKMDLDEYL